MPFLFATTIKEIKRRLNDPVSLLMWLGIPLILGTLLGAVMGGGDGPRPKVLMLLTDLDGTFISEAIPRAVSGGPLAEMITIDEVGEDLGRSLLEEGRASAHLVIRKGFADAYLDNKPFVLELTVNPAQSISPRLVRDVLNTLLDLGHYVQMVLGDEIRILARGDGGLDTTEVSTMISGKMQRISPYVFPPVISIIDKTPKTGSGSTGLGILMFPGVLLMAVVFAGQGISSNYWVERDKGTLWRWRASPNRGWVFWGGQYLAAMLLLGLVCIPLLAGGFYLLGIPWAKFISALCWLMLTGPLMFAFLTLFQVIAPSRKAGNVITTLLIFPLLMVGGSFFPRETMPSWLAPIAEFTPNGRILEPLKQYLLGHFGASGLLAELLPLMAATLVLIVTASLLVERKFKA